MRESRNFNVLITFNEKKQPQYNGKFKLEINSVSKTLKVFPNDERFNDITAIYEWKFIRLKNILFVFANLDLLDFVLVFKNEEICIDVLSGIFKNRDVDSVADEILQERFMIPMFKNASKNWRMKKFLEEWIQKFDEKEKNKYLNLLKWHHENPEFDDDEIDIKDVKVKIEPLPEKNRKRRHHEIDNNLNNLSDTVNFVDHDNFDGLNSCNVDESLQRPPTQMNNHSFNLFTKIDHPNFKIMNYETASGFRRKLLIFASSDKSQCYEFIFYREKHFFNHRCKTNVKGIKAILDLDENGIECIKMEDKNHQCSPILFEPEKYIELKILKKPNYELLENCATKSKKLLIIFDSNDRNQCYEYSWRLKEKIFSCRGCGMKGKSWSSAEILHENTETEYVILSNNDHSCEMRKYNPEKYFSSNDIVLSPNFEIQTKLKNGIERKILIIFVGNDRKFRYIYYFKRHNNLFNCKGCLKNKKFVSAKIWKNAENEDYVILSNVQHVCSDTRRKENETRRKENETRRKENETRRKENETRRKENETRRKENDNRRKENETRRKGITILRPPNFKYIDATEKFVSKLLIFDSTDPTLCYTFSQHRNVYRCLGCNAAQHNKNVDGNKFHQTKKIATVILGQDDGPNGEYFVKFNDGEKHHCEPKKYEPEKYDLKILKPKIDYILFREKSKSKYVNLLIYHPEDEKLCYKYSNLKGKNIFQCPACRKLSTFVSARLHQNSDGTEYLTTNKKEHICTPIEYSSVITADTTILEKSGLDFKESKKKEIDETRIVRRPNFELRRNKLGVPEKRLIVFFDEDRKLCYDYGYRQLKDRFLCKICSISAKIQIDEENGNEKYVILGETKHKCDPVIYEPEKEIIKTNNPKKIKTIKPKKNKTNMPKKTILPSKEPEKRTSNFMIFNQDNKKKPTKLVIFTSSTNEMCYEYILSKHTKKFHCCRCIVSKKMVSAKLLSEDGKECVQFLKNEHICTPKKFILEEFQPKIISQNGFELCTNKYGKPNSRLILFDSENNGFFYNYYLGRNNHFLCSQCCHKNTTVWAKLFEKENGEKYLELSSKKHACKPKSEKSNVINNFVIHFNDSGVRDSRLTVLNDDDKSLGYRYSLKPQNVFCCIGCSTKNKYSSAKVVIDKNGKQSLELNEHFCTIKNLKKEKLYFSDYKYEEEGSILITMDPTQKNRIYKFAYDEKLETFCCSKCLEMNKYITATICEGNDKKDFVLLNVPHCCTSFVSK